MEATREVSRIKVLWMLVAIFAVLPLAQAAGDWVFLVSLVGVLGTLGWLGVNWGADSQDGRDWHART
jgi:hypothetical protein